MGAGRQVEVKATGGHARHGRRVGGPAEESGDGVVNAMSAARDPTRRWLSAKAHRNPLASRLWREWCFLKVVFVHIRVRLAIVAAILLVGAWMFMVFEPEKKHSLPRAVHCTWCLVFGEPPEEFPQSTVLQTLFFVLPVLGLTVIIEAIVDLALTLRDRRRSERSWCAMMATSLSNHVVLVGLGKLGFRTYGLLRRLNEPVVVIEKNADCQFLEEVRRDQAPLFIGDARREAVLADANVAKARSIILATDDDLANLEVALDARRMAPKISVVLRMFDQNMADKIRDGFNIYTAMSQSAISAPAFATAALDPAVVNSFMVNDRLIVMQRWLVQPGGPLAGRSVGQIMTDFGFGVVERHAADGTLQVIPPPEARLEVGDRLVVQGLYEALATLRRRAIDVTESLAPSG